MFKNPFQVAITFAIVGLIIKLVLFSMDMQHGAMEDGIKYIYLFLILMAVFFGIRSNKIAAERQTTFGEDFKSGARAASFFALLAAAITYAYYTKIDTDFFEIKQQPFIEELHKQVKLDYDPSMTPKDLAVYKEKATNQMKGIMINLSPYMQAMWTMFGLVFLGMVYSAIFSLLMKKFPGFKK